MNSQEMQSHKGQLDLCFVVPVKSPGNAKQRLSDVLDHQQRKDLASHLYQHTLSYLMDQFPEHDVLVVSENQRVLQVSAAMGCKTLLQTDDKGLNSAMEQAASKVSQQGYQAMMMLPADLAFLSRNELSRVLQYRDRYELILAEANDGGTNALLVQPPNAIRFRFGLNSAKAHQREATKANLRVCMLKLPLMAVDIDKASDLAIARQAKSKALQGLDQVLCFSRLQDGQIPQTSGGHFHA